MKLIVAAVGTRMPGWVQAGWDDYARRLPADCALTLLEVKPEPRTNGKTPAQMLAQEARRITTKLRTTLRSAPGSALPEHAHLIALDERGTELTTVQLAGELARWRASGHDLAFLIGGPDGLAPDLKAACQQRLRLSALTLPHPLVRVLLAEQMYRAWSVMVGHPYHRA